MRGSILVPLFLALLVPAAAARAALTMSFGPTGPSVSGASASGQVAWVAVALTPRQYFQEISEFRETVFADASGTASLNLASDAPRRSVWVAVDVGSGDFAVGTPEDYPVLQEGLTGSRLAFDSQSQATGLLLEQEKAKVLLIRPGSGAWSIDALDGSPEDADAEVNSALAVNLGALEPMTLSTSAAPPALQAGDVLVMIDPTRLSVTATSVPASLLAGGGT